MDVEFKRTRDRGYAVRIRRAGYPDVEMDPAPGFDTKMPHDLMHFVVEAELGLELGVFGQLAAGGNAGTFRPVTDPNVSAKEARRMKRRLARRGDKIAREGSTAAAWSERAAHVCEIAWGVHRPSDVASPTYRQVRAKLSEEEREALSEGMVEQICTRLDELSGRWTQVKVGESLVVEWPAVR